MPDASSFQITLPEKEDERIRQRIDSDFQEAHADHQDRLERWMGYFRKWRNRAQPNPEDKPDAPNFAVPLTKWHVFTKFAKEVDALFGGDAEIVAVPTGPSDARNVRKISRYMTWRVFVSMKLVPKFAVFIFRKILFGRSFAYCPWVRHTYDVRGEQVLDYEGPDFQPLWPDDLIVPAERAGTIHEFSFVIRKYVATPEELLKGEREGAYQGITDNWQKILDAAHNQPEHRDSSNEPVQSQADEAEGILRDSALSQREALRVYEWYGRRRMLKSRAPDADADETDTKKREMRQTELRVRYIPTLHLTVGVQDLATLYPDMKDRRPFVEASMAPDGSYFPAGLGEKLEEIEEELTATNNLGVAAGEMSVWPMVFARPGAGVDTADFVYGPKQVVWTEDPQGVNVVQIKTDLSYITVYTQALLGYAERVAGQTDQNLGRTSDRPNQPRTLGQNVLLLEEGNVQAALETRMLREDMSKILLHFWELDSSFAGPNVFFRVTEEDAQGLFKTIKGGAFISEKERHGRYDFNLKFATSSVNREVARQRQVELYQIDLQNPFFLNNPRALWQITNKLHKDFGDLQFANLVPEPPDTDPSISPQEELARLQNGEEIHVRPGDDDSAHLIRHDSDIRMLRLDPDHDTQLVERLAAHYLEQIRQMQMKRLMQALLADVAQNAGPLLEQLGPLNPAGPGGEQGGSGGVLPQAAAPGGQGPPAAAGLTGPGPDFGAGAPQQG